LGVVVYTSFREVAWAALRHPCGDSCEAVERERERGERERARACAHLFGRSICWYVRMRVCVRAFVCARAPALVS
jgi:hypothetical protein